MTTAQQHAGIDLRLERNTDTIRAWVEDAFSKQMRWVIVCVWTVFLLLVVPAVVSAIVFFQTEDTKLQILCAVIFVCCSQWTGFIKVFAWVTLQRPRMDRAFEGIEGRVAQLSTDLDSMKQTRGNHG